MEGQGAQAQRVQNSSEVNNPNLHYAIIFRDNSNGFYWAKLSDGTIEPLWSSIGSGDWKYNGNTVVSEKWIGTIDNFDFPIRVNSTEVARVQTDLSFQIGGQTIGGGEKFNVQNSTFSTTAKFSNTLASAGVHYGIYSTATGAGGGSNIGGYFSATGGASNIAGYFDSGDVLLVNGGLYINNPVDATSKFTAKSSGATIASFGIRLYNSTPVEIFSVASSGHITAGLAADHNLFIGNNVGRSITSGILNTGLGSLALQNITTGDKNTGIGAQSLNAITVGGFNTAVGYTALLHITGANYNTAIGVGALFTNVAGDGNTAIGMQSLQMNTGGSNVGIGFNCGVNSAAVSNNTFIGSSAGYTNTTGNSSVFIGYQAGYWETLGNKLFIDNTQRAGEADGRIKSLIYGVFDAATANQILAFNAAVINVQYIPVGNAVLSSGDLYVDTAANIAGNGDLIVGRKV